ncbi:MAG: hypothetical protein ACRDKH_00170 [Solirubrobacterales bacterium]
MYYKHETSESDSITIRHARPEDADAIERLAERDSGAVPAGDLLVAAVGGELRAAVSVERGETIADPFHPTSELVRLLTARSAQLRPAADGRGRGLAAILRRRERTISPQPAGTLRAFNWHRSLR